MLARDASCASEHENAVRREDATHAVHERDARVSDLPFSRLSAKLNHRFDHLPMPPARRGWPCESSPP